MGDVVVAFRRDGTVVQEWSLLDILDPYRISYDSLDPDWKLVYGEEETTDWSHGNAVVVDPADGGIVVSLRNQDAVVKFSRDAGELVWILGPHGRWEAPWSDALLTPTTQSSGDRGSPFEWSYHQHAPMFMPDGAVLLFDNGNGRAIPPDPELDTEERYSRAVEYRIDEATRAVTQTWAYGGPDDPWYSGALGDADLLPATGNVLVVDGFEMLPDDSRYARLFEVTRDDPAQVVWEVEIRDETGDPPLNWTVYRAERLPSVYP
jgi:arylsulfate sulfotransferase